MDRNDGQPLKGWPHVQQSIAVILMTPIGSRVMRRDFGSEVPLLIDRPMTSQVVLALYAAVADALARWEPRFRLVGVQMAQPTASGAITIRVRGEYQGDIVDTDVEMT
ncbi:GPW/gp25 family protein [Limimaricola hongkongensis]|uniref:GPW/gp25 n=1 Tax=Limimaricola hongkongensis DSM 17492 TaxID=1122180 RepID=A0A017HBW8_9RHOB|nr:GPW/gp25 family protein [Limimaricola hongkongensis]EYD71810.1 GPW/gp25 [Limimaricola hongkongensis DSM 17492]